MSELSIDDYLSAAGGLRRGDHVRVYVEIPKHGRIKRDARGRIEFISPWPLPFRAPFNYGCVLGRPAGPDGEAVDALYLGKPQPRGAVLKGMVVALVLFEDRGVPDPKVIVSEQPMNAVEHAELFQFFTRYAKIKCALRLTKKTVFRGWA